MGHRKAGVRGVLVWSLWNLQEQGHSYDTNQTMYKCTKSQRLMICLTYFTEYSKVYTKLGKTHLLRDELLCSFKVLSQMQISWYELTDAWIIIFLIPWGSDAGKEHLLEQVFVRLHH